jgi:hypothetical protein
LAPLAWKVILMQLMPAARHQGLQPLNVEALHEV